MKTNVRPLKKVTIRPTPATIPLPAKSADGSAPRKMPADDNPMKLMSIAMKPLCAPPFPLDYLEEMTALMGGDGRIR